MKSKSEKQQKEHTLIVEWGGLTAGAYDRPAVFALLLIAWPGGAEIHVAGEGELQRRKALAQDTINLNRIYSKNSIRRICHMEFAGRILWNSHARASTQDEFCK